MLPCYRKLYTGRGEQSQKNPLRFRGRQSDRSLVAVPNALTV